MLSKTNHSILLQSKFFKNLPKDGKSFGVLGSKLLNFKNFIYQLIDKEFLTVFFVLGTKHDFKVFEYHILVKNAWIENIKVRCY